MIELPDEYSGLACDTGYETARMYINGLAGRADRYILAKEIVENKTKEELIKYIAQIFLAIEALKVKSGGVEI